jgi:hypothetical protein
MLRAASRLSKVLTAQASPSVDPAVMRNRELCEAIVRVADTNAHGRGKFPNEQYSELVSELRTRGDSLRRKDLLHLLKCSPPDNQLHEFVVTQYKQNEIDTEEDYNKRVKRLVILANLIPPSMHMHVPGIVDELLMDIPYDLSRIDQINSIFQLLYVLNKVNGTCVNISNHIPLLTLIPPDDRFSPESIAAVLWGMFRLDLTRYISPTFVDSCVSIILTSDVSTVADVSTALMAITAHQSVDPRFVSVSPSGLIEKIHSLLATHPISDIDRHQLSKALWTADEVSPWMTLVDLVSPSSRLAPSNTSRAHKEVVRTLQGFLPSITSEKFVPEISAYIDIVIGNS